MRMRFPKSAPSPNQQTAKPRQPPQRPAPQSRPRPAAGAPSQPRQQSPAVNRPTRPANDDFMSIKPLEDNSAPASQRQRAASQPKYLTQPKRKKTTSRSSSSRRGSKSKPVEENNMALVARGVGLLVGGIVACLFPLAGGQSEGSGKTRALVYLLRALGPFAPLAGIALGIAGAVLIMMGLKKVSKAVSGSIAAISVVVVLICGGIGMTPTLSQMAGSSNSGGSSSNSSSWANFFASSEAKAMLKVVDEYEEAVLQTLGENPERIPESQVASKFKALGSKLGKIDVSDCPKDFQSAFRIHASSWGRLGSAASSLQTPSATPFGNNMRAEMDYSKAQRELESSWHKIKTVANKHGLEIRDE